MSTGTRDLLSILFFVLVMGLVAVLAPDDLDAARPSVLLGFLLLAGAGVITPILVRVGSRRAKQRRKEQRLAELLAGLSLSLEEVLAEAPYAYGHWQGEDGYRIYDRREPDKFVAFATSAFEAELWIVEHYVETRGAKDRQT